VDAKDKEHTIKYLTISEKHVHLGQEVIDHYNALTASGNYNYEYHFMVGKEIYSL
jgi:hypothetical protein